MKPPVEHVRVSEKGREILIRLKRKTGLEHWNELCRIAYCRSIANPSPPKIDKRPGEGAIDMEWRTFAGPYQDLLAAITYARANKDGISLDDRDAVAEYFRAHIERGVAGMFSVRSLEELAGAKIEGVRSPD